jgi:hypothetical protein
MLLLDFKVQGVYNDTLWFVDVLKTNKRRFRVLSVSWLLQKFKFPTKYLGYLTDHL